MFSHILLLGSGSRSRQLLLKEAGIQYEPIARRCELEPMQSGRSLSETVIDIACYKMEHVILPVGTEGQEIYILTADTLVQDHKGTLHGKPTDRQDAIEKIKALRGTGNVETGFCLDKRVMRAGMWQLKQRNVRTVRTVFKLDIADAWIHTYLDKFPFFLETSGGLSVEGYGAQFLQAIEGSYTNILGLPMCEVRLALEALDFFK